MNWKESDISKDTLNAYKERLGIDEILASVLINRGYSLEDCDTIINYPERGITDPTVLTNGIEASERIMAYMNNRNGYIVIFGDYDVDGETSTKILRTILNKYAKCRVDYYIPERNEGYGINNNFADECIKYSQNSSKDMLVITVDNGINQAEVINKLIDNGIDCVVLDHHVLNENAKLPNCICVDPNVYDLEYGYLAGCGVAFKIAQLISWNYSDGEEMAELTAFVAMGTIADAVPLSIENICLVKYGLSIINSKQCPKGVKAFKEYKGIENVTPVNLAWDIAPLINACGRMGCVSVASDFFFSDELEVGVSIDDVIVKAINLNKDRKSLTKKAVKELEKFNCSNDSVCIFEASNYPVGIMGIIAGKATEIFKKPAVIVSGNKTLHGSARSVYGFDINKALQSAFENKLVIKCGGHKEAVGLEMHKDKINDLRAFLNKYVVIEAIDSEEEEVIIDGTITLKDLNAEFHEKINSISYNNEPMFIIKNLKVVGFKASKNNPENICLTVTDGKKRMSIWAWGAATSYREINSPKNISIIGIVSADFMNPGEYTLNIKEIKQYIAPELCTAYTNKFKA